MDLMQQCVDELNQESLDHLKEQVRGKLRAIAERQENIECRQREIAKLREELKSLSAMTLDRNKLLGL